MTESPLLSMLCGLEGIILFFFSSCAAGSAEIAASPSSFEIVRIAVTDDLDQISKGLIDKTLSALKDQKGADYSVETILLSEDELKEAVKQQKVDAFIAPSQIYRQSLRYGAKDIAVTIPSQGSNPNASDGAALLIRLDRSDKVRLENWERLRVTLAGAMSSTAFTSLRDELLSKLTIDNAKLHLPSQAAAVPMEEGIRRLQSGETDVLMLSACALENYSKHAVLPVNMMLLNAKEDTGLNCLHSTHLFQGITFAAMPSLSVQTFNRLSTQVLSVSVPGSARWAMATDFSGLDKALERLDSDAWASLREPDWTIFFKKYQAWFLGAAVIACLAVFNIFLLGLMVKKRTRELVSSIREQNRLRKVAARTHEKLEKLQRLTTVGQMASLFAHELRQPLNALSCYAYGLQRALEAEKISHRDDVSRGLNGLFQQISRPTPLWIKSGAM